MWGSCREGEGAERRHARRGVSVSIIVTSTFRRFLALRLLVTVFAASCLFVFFLKDFDLCAGPLPFSLLLGMSAIAQSAPRRRQ